MLKLINDYINGHIGSLQRKMRTAYFNYAYINRATKEGKDYKLSVILKDREGNQFSSQHILHGVLLAEALGNVERFNGVVAEGFAKLARRIWAYSNEIGGGSRKEAMAIDKAIQGKMCKHSQRDLEAIVDMEG